MSLRLTKRGAVWYVRGTVAKSYIFETTGTPDRERAEAYRAKREAGLWDRRFFGERATVALGEAAAKYLEECQPGQGDRRLLARIIAHFGETKLLREIDQAAADSMLASVLRPGVGPATKRRTLSPLEAVLNHSARRGWCERPAFVKPALPDGKTRWLTPAETHALLGAAAKHLRPLLHFIVCTGARLSEAIELEWDHVDLAAGVAVFMKTKNGNKRVAALTSACIVTLANLPHREGAVFRRDDGKPYADKGRLEGGQIKTAWRGACKRAGVAAATPHDLRHTWATWFYALSKDLMLLRDEGDWATVAQVERYAHLMAARLVPEIAGVWGEHPRIAARTERQASATA